MSKAERLMSNHPDSALVILSKLDTTHLAGPEEKARYALLKSMALDKNYIDTTTFDVLQPALDYYPTHGNTDEKRRTYYYQGRIYQNNNEFDKAMLSFMRAEGLQGDFYDTITYAHVFVAQGNLYYRSYQLGDYVENNLKAARLYQSVGNTHYMIPSLIRALDGAITLENKHRADSIFAIVNSFKFKDAYDKYTLSLVEMTYNLQFGSEDYFNEYLESLGSTSVADDSQKINIAIGYLKHNKPQMAYRIFNTVLS